MSLFSRWRRRLILLSAVVGPGIITAFADNDAGGVATYSVAAAKFGYSMLVTLIPITAVLMITQEMGSRLAIVTGKGLGDLIRERFGVRVALAIFGLLFGVNLVVVIQNLSGLKDALKLFGLNEVIFLPVLVGLLFAFITKASYAKVEKFFLGLILFYGAYLVSAVLAKPDWGLVARSLVWPTGGLSFDYGYTAVAVLGATVTAWGQFFINSYVKDKKLTAEGLKYNQWEVRLGAVMTNVVSLFIMVAVTAALFAKGIRIEGVSQAALAIRPLVGDLAGVMFGVGLLVAGFIGAAIVPLATAYAFSEFFGFEGSLDVSYTKSRLFYGFFLVQILLGLLIVSLPGVSLFKITLAADFLNGMFLPVLFWFLYKFANNPDLMGEYKNSAWQNWLLVGSAIVISLAAIVGGVGKVLGV